MEFTFDKLYLWLGFLMNVFSQENPYNLSDSEREKLMALLEESEQTQKMELIMRKGHSSITKNEDSVKQKLLNCVLVKDIYTKADVLAMLEELKKSIEDKVYNVSAYSECLDCDVIDYEDVNEIIIEKINSLKENTDDN